jgi:hypothetical protein
VLSKFQGGFFRHNVLNCRKACRKCCHDLSNTSELRIRLSYETGSRRLHPCNFVTLLFASGVPMCKSTARVFTNYHNLSKEVCSIGRCIYYIPRIKFSSSHVITNACRCSLSVPIILHLHAQNMSPIYTSSNYSKLLLVGHGTKVACWSCISFTGKIFPKLILLLLLFYLFFERFSIQKCQNFSENHHFFIFGFQYVGKNIKG